MSWNLTDLMIPLLTDDNIFWNGSGVVSCSSITVSLWNIYIYIYILNHMLTLLHSERPKFECNRVKVNWYIFRGRNSCNFHFFHHFQLGLLLKERIPLYSSCPNFRHSSEPYLASLLLAKVDCPFHHNINLFCYSWLLLRYTLPWVL